MEEDKKEESIERIIKILEQHLENSETMFENFGTLAIEYADIKRISNVLSRLKQLEEENKILRKTNDWDIDYWEQLYDDLAKNSIPKSKVKEILEKEELPLTIVGGRRNRKTLEYGRKLGRIETCKEFLGEE